MNTCIKTPRISAIIESKGAQLVSLIYNETEFIWQRDAAFWGKCSPVLFPVVGILKNGKTQINGQDFFIPKHGFASGSDFTVESQSPDSVCFSLCSDEKTKAVYPFDFKLSITYTLKDDSISFEYAVENTGGSDMLYGIGGHPAFNCPLKADESFEDYEIRFEKDESEGCPLLNKNGIIHPDIRSNPFSDSKTISLDYALFDNDALIFDKLRSRKVRLISKKSGFGVQMNFDGFNYFGIWTPDQKRAPFVCLEPWTSLNDYTGESENFEQKRGIKKLTPGMSDRFKFTITCFCP